MLAMVTSGLVESRLWKAKCLLRGITALSAQPMLKAL